MGAKFSLFCFNRRTASTKLSGRGRLAALLVVALLVLASSLSAVAAKPPVPDVRIPLANLGFPGYRVALMHAGASMITLHLLDKDHLLFTFGLRALVPRLPGDAPTDQDRLVGAEVVEIPSGKVLDRTEWRLHDHGRYLWSVGRGVFVLRSGDDLSTFAPLRGLRNHTSFQRVALPHRAGHPELISGSPDAQIVTVESQKISQEQEGSEAGDRPRRKHAVLEFYRLIAPQPDGSDISTTSNSSNTFNSSDGPVQLKAAGVIGSPGLLRLALDGDGYLWADTKETDRLRWAVSFNEYEGKPQDLMAIDSSCSPRLELLSRSEFVAVTCKGSEDSTLLSVYGFDGQLNWQQTLGGETLQPPTFVSAPEAGRFAMSRLVPSSTGMANTSGNGPVLDDGTLSQVVRVYATASGTQLLSVPCLPAARTAENFDLSPDGRTLAVLSADAIDLYRMHDLSDRERKDLADAQTMLPPKATGPVVLRRISRPVVAEESPIASEETTAPQPASPADGGTAPAPASAPAATVAGASVAGTDNAETAGSAQPTAADPTSEGTGRRKPPTLLAPGESQEYKAKPETTPH